MTSPGSDRPPGRRILTGGFGVHLLAAGQRPLRALLSLSMTAAAGGSLPDDIEFGVTGLHVEVVVAMQYRYAGTDQAVVHPPY